MKKIFGFLICTLLISVRVYAEADIPTDKSYTFDRDNVASVLAEFIEDEKKAEKAADKYNELSNNIENAISAVDFVDVCVAGGMNMKLVDGSGYIKCLDMFMKLIEMQNLDAGGFDMYCPATGNALKSITDKTQVGDVCGGTRDTYIEYGYVTLKTDNKNGQHKYVCTCTPQSCKDGYYWNKEKHQCSVKDKEGYCVRHILGSFEYKKDKFPTSGVGINDLLKKSNAYYNDKYAQMNASLDAFGRCIEYGAIQGCRIRGALATADSGSGFTSAKKYQVICNPANYEIEADKKIQEDKEKKHKAELAENMTYYEVCGKDKGKGICIDNVFTRKIIGGTQASYATGNALVKEYARVRLGDEITCGGDSYDKNIRKSGIEYFIKCRSLKDLTKYYEFKFDDLEESKDLTANSSVYNAVWHIIYNYNIAKNSYNGYDTGTKANCDAVNATFKKICNGCGTEWRESGYTATMGKKFCYDLININTTCKRSPNDLNTAFDIDPFVFCKNTHNQLKNTSSMESLLKQYLSDKSGVATYNIECYPQTLCYTGSGCEGIIGLGDDIKTCVVHGNKDYTVDFVFDDINEFSKKLNEGALQSMACVVSKGTFTGQECIVANKEQCDALIKSTSQICPECKKAKWNPTTKLCELPDAKTVTQLEKGKTIAMIVGGTVVAVGVTVATVGSGAPVVVIVLSGLEVVGGGIELGTQIHIDGMAHDFLLESVKCQDASCAERLIKENMQSLANITNDMQDYEINAVDEEFARLLKLIPEDSAFYQRIVENGAKLEDNKKGFFDPEGWNQAQVWRAIGIGLQFSSLTTGVIKKLIEAPRFANKFPKMQKVLIEEVKINIPKYEKDINPSVIEDVAVRAVYQKAYDAEPLITEDLARMVSRRKGNLHGLEYRMKTPESTLGKLERDRRDLIAEKGADFAQQITDVALIEDLKDIIRYTFASSADDLVSETKLLMADLKNEGYKIVRVKNTFLDPDTPIDMINMRVISPEGQVFELQANTPHNLYVKDKLMHADYEAWRVIKDKDSPEAQELSRRMFETAKQFEIPKNIETLR